MARSAVEPPTVEFHPDCPLPGFRGVKPGTNLLVTGPSMIGKRDLALELLRPPRPERDTILYVTTDRIAPDVLGECRERFAEETVSGIDVVDCITHQAKGVSESSTPVTYVSAPNDLTGIGISLTNLLKKHHDEEGTSTTRLIFDTLTTVVMYTEPENVYRFLHVLTSRLRTVDAFSVFPVNLTSFDEQLQNRLLQLFDGVMELREGPTGSIEFRGRGLSTAPSSWTEVASEHRR